jgi:hypothetical protein
VVAHTCNPSTQEAEAGGFISSRPAWATPGDFVSKNKTKQTTTTAKSVFQLRMENGV